MAHDSIANPGSGGDTFVTVDLALATYPSGSGKAPATVLYASPNLTTAPTAFVLGQKTMANSLGVVVASDQSAIPVSQNGTWNVGTVTTVSTLTTVTNPVTVVGDAASGAAKAGNPVQVGGVFNTTQPTVTTGQMVESQYTARGAAIVATGIDTFTVTIGSALPAGTNVIGHVIVDSGTITTVSAVTSITNALPSGSNVIGHVICDSGSTTVVTGTVTIVGDAASGAANAGNPVKVGGVFNTTQPTVTTAQAVDAQYTARGAAIVATGVDTFTVTVGAALPAGTNVIGHVIVDSGTITTVSAVTAITNALPAGTNTIGGVTPVSSTTGGATPFRYVIAAGANQDSQNVKASAGTVYSIDAFLAVGTLRYLKLYDKATAPTSADTPVHTFLIPGNTAGAGFTKSIPVGMLFANGIGFRVTTGLADNDTGPAVANDGVINLDYK